MTGPKGIKWSAPVLIRKESDGLVVSVPKQVSEALDAGEGDVLNFTRLPDGAIEVWRVKKTSYASLEAMADRPARYARPKSGPKKTTRAGSAGVKRKKK